MAQWVIPLLYNMETQAQIPTKLSMVMCNCNSKAGEGVRDVHGHTRRSIRFSGHSLAPDSEETLTESDTQDTRQPPLASARAHSHICIQHTCRERGANQTDAKSSRRS